MLTENIIIPDPRRVEKIKEAMKVAGAQKLQVVSDFDRTLTAGRVNGERAASLISVLRDEKYLTPDYPAKAQALFNKYHPLEIDHKLSLAAKKEAMHEWWLKHYDLLLASGLSREDIKRAAQSAKIALRPGASEFLDFLKERGVPLIILSSSGLGTENITFYLERFNKLSANIHIVFNEFIWTKTAVRPEPRNR